MVPKIGRERIWFSITKDQCTDRVRESACNEQGHGSHTKLVVNRPNEKNDDPAHEQEADVRHQHGNLCEENRFDGDEKHCQTPDDAEQHPSCGSAEDGEAKRGIRPCDENVDGIVVENPKDSQILIEKQKEMQETTEQE